MDFNESRNLQHCWDNVIFLSPDEVDNWQLNEGLSGDYEKKTVSHERERRKMLNEKLYALRSLVPSITKMDKISIVKDAIDYVVELQDQERKLVADISELERKSEDRRVDVEGCAVRKPRPGEPIDVKELQVNDIGDSTCVVSITYSRKRHSVTRLCEALEALSLRILSANLTTFSSNVLLTLLVKTEGCDGADVKDAVHGALTNL